MEELNVVNAKNNVKIYKKYKMFAYDWLFFYAIQVMFFTITKKFSMSEVMYITAFYATFVFFWQIPANFISEKLGLKRSVVLGNILVSLNCLLYIFVPNVSGIIFSDCLGSLGFTLKSLAEGTLLYTSMKKLDKRDLFSKVEGKANSKYYYYDAVASILSGFLFVVNNYIPVILCFIHILIALKMSLGFKNLINDEKDDSLRLRDVANQFKLIMKSNRSKSIFLFAFVFMGIITVFGNLYKAILMELNMATQYITIIVCISTVLSGVGAKSVYYIEKQTKNKTLSVFGISYVIGMLLVGLCGVSANLNVITLSIILISLAFMGILQGAYRVAIKKYVLNFTNTQIRTKITSAYYMFENIGKALSSFMIGGILSYMSSSNACVLFACFSFVIIIFVIMYMKNKLGLKPEQYDPKEIYNKKIIKN